MELSEDDLRDIIDKLWDARSNWYNIGLELEMKPADLDVIEKDGNDIDSKFRKMILKWLRSGKRCTWKALYVALSAPSVGLSRLADKIQQQTNPTSCVKEGQSLHLENICCIYFILLTEAE